MCLKFHISILLCKQSRGRKECGEGLINQLAFFNHFSVQAELGCDLVKFSIEGHEVRKVHHVQLDPIALGLSQVDCFLMQNAPPVASTSHLVCQLGGTTF